MHTQRPNVLFPGTGGLSLHEILRKCVHARARFWRGSDEAPED